MNGKRRDIGLGGFPDVTLSAAREAARVAREKIKSGVDPVEERAEERKRLAAERKLGLTFAEAVEKFLISGKLDTLQNAKHQAQWRSTLETYAIPVIGTRPLVDVDVSGIKAVLDPIWTTKHENTTRVRSRLESVFSWATVAGHFPGNNPAIWKGNLKELMPAINKDTVKTHHPALGLGDVAPWFAALRSRKELAARALEFLTLTAARSNEVRLATWDEMHLDERLWIIPGARMKMRREHSSVECCGDRTSDRASSNGRNEPGLSFDAVAPDVRHDAVCGDEAHVPAPGERDGSTLSRSAPPFRMGYDRPSATGWQRGLITPATWLRSHSPTKSAAPSSRRIAAATWWPSGAR